MTIITAVQKNNEIAIACDTQSISGNWQLKHTAEYKSNDSKLLTHGQNIFGFAGSLAVPQIFEDLLSEAEPEILSSRSQILRWFLSHHSKLKDYYHLKTDIGNGKGQVVEVNWVSALLVNPSGIFSINRYREVIEHTKFWAIGSGEAFALGALENLYDQNLSAAKTAEMAVLTATKFDPGCASPIHVKSMTKTAEPRPKSKAKSQQNATSGKKRTTTRKKKS